MATPERQAELWEKRWERRFTRYANLTTPASGTPTDLLHMGFSPTQLANERILDVASGMHGTPLRAAPRSYGLDPLHDNWGGSEKEVKNRGIVGVAQALPFRGGSFDHATSHLGVGFYPSIPLGNSILELVRVVKTNGSIRLLKEKNPPGSFGKKIQRLQRALADFGVVSRIDNFLDPAGRVRFEVWHMVKTKDVDVAHLRQALIHARLFDMRFRKIL